MYREEALNELQEHIEFDTYRTAFRNSSIRAKSIIENLPDNWFDSLSHAVRDPGLRVGFKDDSGRVHSVICQPDKFIYRHEVHSEEVKKIVDAVTAVSSTSLINSAKG